MTWFKQIAAAVVGGMLTTGLIYLAVAFLDYGPLVQKEDARAESRRLEESLLELADCVDTPTYDAARQRVFRDPRCRQVVLDAMRGRDGLD